MNIKAVFLILISFAIKGISDAQSVTEKLGGIKTNFSIYSDTIDLKTGNQVIILRAEKSAFSDDFSGYGYGYGYQSYHLEFCSKKDFVVKPEKGNKYRLVFYDSKRNMLVNSEIPAALVNFYYNFDPKDPKYFYSIDLIDIPGVVLDQTSILNITRTKEIR